MLAFSVQMKIEKLNTHVSDDLFQLARKKLRRDSSIDRFVFQRVSQSQLSNKFVGKRVAEKERAMYQSSHFLYFPILFSLSLFFFMHKYRALPVQIRRRETLLISPAFDVHVKKRGDTS